ncbi:MAG TPA: hypothetical protein VJU15_05765 [Gemmatimonadales bacterium]|nr:hypothetical protein [Gemmatimonadales bacterium]
MIVRAVRDALLSHGWEGETADAAAAGLESWTHRLEGLIPEQVESLLRAASRFGVDLITGPDWAVLNGTRSRLSSLARSWSLPPELHEIVVAIGTALPSDPAPLWRDGDMVHDLSKPVVVDDREIARSRDRQIAGGLVIRGASEVTAMADIERGLNQALIDGIDSETIAIDPGWSPPLDRFRRFGRPIICTTDDPVRAALARLAGAQIFVTAVPDVIQRALELVETV